MATNDIKYIATGTSSQQKLLEQCNTEGSTPIQSTGVSINEFDESANKGFQQQISSIKITASTSSCILNTLYGEEASTKVNTLFYSNDIRNILQASQNKPEAYVIPIRFSFLTNQLSAIQSSSEAVPGQEKTYSKKVFEFSNNLKSHIAAQSFINTVHAHLKKDQPTLGELAQAFNNVDMINLYKKAQSYVLQKLVSQQHTSQTTSIPLHLVKDYNESKNHTNTEAKPPESFITYLNQGGQTKGTDLDLKELETVRKQLRISVQRMDEEPGIFESIARSLFDQGELLEHRSASDLKASAAYIDTLIADFNDSRTVEFILKLSNKEIPVTAVYHQRDESNIVTAVTFTLPKTKTRHTYLSKVGALIIPGDIQPPLSRQSGLAEAEIQAIEMLVSQYNPY